MKCSSPKALLVRGAQNTLSPILQQRDPKGMAKKSQLIVWQSQLVWHSYTDRYVSPHWYSSFSAVTHPGMPVFPRANKETAEEDESSAGMCPTGTAKQQHNSGSPATSGQMCTNASAGLAASLLLASRAFEYLTIFSGNADGVLRLWVQRPTDTKLSTSKHAHELLACVTLPLECLVAYLVQNSALFGTEHSPLQPLRSFLLRNWG